MHSYNYKPPFETMQYEHGQRVFFLMFLNNRKLTTGMTLAAMSGKRTLQEWRVRTNSCLYLSVSSCSVTLFVLITSFFNTITNWKTDKGHYIFSIFHVYLCRPCMDSKISASNMEMLCMSLTSSTLRDETRSRASCKVFFLTSRSGELRTRRMSITRSWIESNHIKS